jgi:hypothetical protein
MIEIVPASPAHIGTLARRMRWIDQEECRALGHNPKQALRASLMNSTVAWTAKVDGRPEAMFGASTICFLTGEGSPWLLMTDEAVRHARALIVEGRRYTERLQGIYPVLRNNVHADNSTAIRWLSHLGYTVGEAFDMGGFPMRPFERRADNV